MADKARRLTRALAPARVEELRVAIRRHDRLYYEAARPEITDTEYDALFAELTRIETRYPDLATEDSPTRRLGDRTSSATRTVTHAIPLQSLDNTYAPAELEAFDARVRQAVANPVYAVEPKIDGVAVALTYRDGRLVVAATRGDGVTGEDVTANARTIPELPAEVEVVRGLTDGDLHLRGEVYITRARFASLVDAMREAGETPYANPRNTAAGALKLLDAAEAARRGLSLFIHSVAGLTGSYMETMDRLSELGFPVAPYRRRFVGIAPLLEILPSLESARHGYAFDTDGLVVKLDAAAAREELGEKSRSPRWAIAYKFAPEIQETTLTAIELQVGRTGVITPVARLEPVLISGSTVSSASLHNEDEILRLDVRVGDRVRVQKAGEIIPQIVSVVPAGPHDGRRGDPFRMPAFCPACGSELAREEGKVKWRCVSGACPATLRARILHFGARDAMEIDGFGESTVDALLTAKLIADVADLYTLNEKTLSELPRLAAKSAANLVAAIDASRARPIERLLIGLGIPGVGEATARDLAQHFRSVDALAEATESDLMAVREIGETLAGGIVRFFADPGLRLVLDKLRQVGLKAFEIVAATAPVGIDLPFAGKTVVITGSIASREADVRARDPRVWDRRACEEAVRRLGGVAGSAVSSRTGLLILGENPGSKYDKAMALGIPMMSAEEFVRLVAGATSPGAPEPSAPAPASLAPASPGRGDKLK